MRYLKKTLLLILFIFSVFNWPHAVEAMEEKPLPDLVNRKIRSGQLIKTVASNSYFHWWMKYYLSQGADINAHDELGRTALHYAMVYLRHDVAEFLLKNGVDPNKKDHQGCTPLMRVVQYSTPVAKSCSGLAEFNWCFCQDRYGGEVRNTIAENHNQVGCLLVEPSVCKSVIELLLQNGADPDTQDNDGKTALMHAGENMWLAELLLKKGANLDVQENDGWTALMYASENRNLTLLLLKAAANPNLQDKEYRDTVLHLAAHRNDIERVRLLALYGGDCHKKNKNKQTPFGMIEGACWCNLVKAGKVGIIDDYLRWYILCGGNLENHDQHHNTLLHHVAWRNQVNSLRTLLAYGARAEQCGNSGMTPLHQAACSGNRGAINLLLKSPQGGPRYASEDVASEEQIITFFLCLNRLFGGKKSKGGERLPFNCTKQTRRNLFLPYLLPMYLLPKAELIDKVPLLQLRHYAKFIGKDALAHALTERHVDQVANILSSVDNSELTPAGRAQAAGHNDDVQDLLRHDRASLKGQYGQRIKDNYLALL